MRRVVEEAIVFVRLQRRVVSVAEWVRVVGYGWLVDENDPSRDPPNRFEIVEWIVLEDSPVTCHSREDDVLIAENFDGHEGRRALESGESMNATTAGHSHDRTHRAHVMTRIHRGQTSCIFQVRYQPTLFVKDDVSRANVSMDVITFQHVFEAYK